MRATDSPVTIIDNIQKPQRLLTPRRAVPALRPVDGTFRIAGNDFLRQFPAQNAAARWHGLPIVSSA
jgi:hypothetical protein